MKAPHTAFADEFRSLIEEIDRARDEGELDTSAHRELRRRVTGMAAIWNTSIIEHESGLTV